MDSEKALKYCQELALQAITGPPPRSSEAELSWDEWHEALRQNEANLKLLNHMHAPDLNRTVAWFGAPNDEVTVEVIVDWMGGTVIRERISLEYFIGEG